MVQTIQDDMCLSKMVHENVNKGEK